MGVTEADAPMLSEEEKKILHRCFHIERITDDEIVFPLKSVSEGSEGGRFTSSASRVTRSLFAHAFFPWTS